MMDGHEVATLIVQVLVLAGTIIGSAMVMANRFDSKLEGIRDHLDDVVKELIGRMHELEKEHYKMVGFHKSIQCRTTDYLQSRREDARPHNPTA